MNKIFTILVTVLLIASCTDETTYISPTGTLTIGFTNITTKEGAPVASTEWRWNNGDELTVAANGMQSTFTYSTAGWGNGSNTAFTKEAIGVAPIQLSFGNSSLTPDQQSANDYRKADYMLGNGTLTVLTIDGTLAHQHTDMVVAISKGKGWETDAQFNQVISDASFQFSLTEEKNCISYYNSGDVKQFRAVVPPDLLPTGNGIKLGTLTFGTGVNTPDVLKNRTA